MQKNNHFGFTLIELLIVVAIIAILAAIAIPNFLAAQVRAKVSRAKSEMQSLGTSLEAYFTDNNQYPMWYWGTGTNIPVSKRLNVLTTPISYISKIPKPDPFATQRELIPAPGQPPQETYDTYDYCDEQTHHNRGFSWTPGLYQRVWRLCSCGPNLRTEYAYEFYDPTNGTVSNGDILRFGAAGKYPNEWYEPPAPAGY
jgi:prepilin-type N-terminal cleavage/methylation domain-containing protein